MMPSDFSRSERSLVVLGRPQTSFAEKAWSNVSPCKDFILNKKFLFPLFCFIFFFLTVHKISAQPSSAPSRKGKSSPSLAAYLNTFKLGADARTEVMSVPGWESEQFSFSLRILARLSAASRPAALEWEASAVASSAAIANPSEALERLVRVSGKAVMVEELQLSPSEAELASRKSVTLVRLVTEEGLRCDVITDRAPKTWPRVTILDELADAVGVMLRSGSGPTPSSADWPEPPASLLMVARSINWHPPTPLGSLGMNYTFFDTVVDNTKMVDGDTEALYAMLTAVGRGTQQGIEGVVSHDTDLISLIDPSQKWFAEHRGDPVRFTGTVRRATRIVIDDPLRRRQVGSDHYWELFLFVQTPLIKIDDRIQDSYPVVCCVRELPDGMPTEQPLSERLHVTGFALKRYGYPLPKNENAPEGFQVSPLIICRDVQWVPEPSTTEATSVLGWIFAGLVAVTLFFMLLGVWSFRRGTHAMEKRARAQLPDRIDLPFERKRED